MSVKRFAQVALFITVFTASTAPSQANPLSDEERTASWEPVIVLTGNAQVFAGEKAGPKIPPGTVLYISQRKDAWLLVPRYNSWLHDQHARPLTEALAFLDAQIKQKPTASLHHYRAIVLSELGRMEESFRDFNAAISLGLKASNVHLNRGVAHARAGHENDAIADFDEAIRLDGKNAQAYFNRGVLHSGADRFSASLKDFDKAIELDPAYAEAYNNRGVVKQAQDDVEAALADYEKAIELRKRYPNALTNRAYIRQLNGDYTSAIADYATALRMAPDSHPTLNDLAWLLATCPDDNIRDGKAALAYAERANLITQNEDPDYLDTLAAAAAEAGDFDRAITTMEKALGLIGDGEKQELEARLELFRQKKPFHESAEAESTGEAEPKMSEPESTPDLAKPDSAKSESDKPEDQPTKESSPESKPAGDAPPADAGAPTLVPLAPAPTAG